MAWSVFLGLALGRSTGNMTASPTQVGLDIWPVLTIFVALAAACSVSAVWIGLPASLMWSTVATLAGAAVALLAGATMARQQRLTEALQGLFVPLVIAGSLSAVIVVVQIFFSDLAGNGWIAATAFPQRASGNLRQPNHLSSLAVWAVVGVVWLHERSSLRRTVAALLAVFLVVSVVLTGSRTGLLGILILAAWAVADRGLSSFIRRLLWIMPVVYALAWWLFRMWASRSLGDVGTVDRIAAGGDFSSARFAIWANTLELIARHPWAGIGFGEFNLAWTLTPFPSRPVQFYDHTHNLLMQWMVELGLPLALLLTLAIAVAMWRVLRAALQAEVLLRPGLRCAAMLIALIMLHSMLEYPLWYSYFLLPTVFAFGICLGSRNGSLEAGSLAPVNASASTSAPWHVISLLMLALTLFAVYDYRKVFVIFEPPPDAAPLASRIEAGKGSIFFAHHAHYAAATTAENPVTATDSLRIASHFLLDSRLMLTLIKAYAELGDEGRARYLADRLREFRNAASTSFFAPCAEAQSAGKEPPYQCTPAPSGISFQDFQ